MKTFVQWLAGRAGYKRLTYSDADYFRLSAKDVRVATAHRESEGPTLEQVALVVGAMPASSETERRDRAIVAFTILTGARVAAVASLKLKHVDLVNNAVFQAAREVRTKNSKTINTWFFPMDDIYRTIVAEWVQYLRSQKGWGDEDPLFPRTKVAPNADREFAAAGLEREHWSSTSRIRTIFETAFERTGLPYYHPHLFRKTLVSHAEQCCRTPEQLKAWSQNLGHDSVTTTLRSYGAVSAGRQAQIMRDLGSPQNSEDIDTDVVRQMVRLAQKPKAPVK